MDQGHARYPGAFGGEPGATWANDTDRVLYQLHVTFHNSCANCIQYAGQISTYWNVPFHRNCSCTNVPIPPGGHSRPFVDFREEVQGLDRDQQARVLGRASLTLIERGVIGWEDVVLRSRIRPLHEVVARKRLTVDAMVRSGVPPHAARDAWRRAHPGKAAPTPPKPPAKPPRGGSAPTSPATPRPVVPAPAGLAGNRAIYQRLRSLGLTDRQIAEGIAGRLGSRLGLGPPAGEGAAEVATAEGAAEVVRRLNAYLLAKLPPPPPE